MTPDPGPTVTIDPAIAPDRAASVCPYLLSADGSWRTRTPNRAHRCVAVDPPARPSARKQADLCLAATFSRCPTFVAARESVGALAGEGHVVPPGGGSRYVVPRTTPVVLDRGNRLAEFGELARSPRIGRLFLLGLMLLTVAALVVARFGGAVGDSGAGGLSPTLVPSPVVSIAPSRSPSPGPSPSPSLAPSAQASPSQGPASSPSQTVASSSSPVVRTYVVKSGDTLSAIAARHGTTTAVLVKLNGIKDPSLIRVGQVLELP